MLGCIGLNNQLYLNDPVLSYSFGIKVLLKYFIELEYYIVCSQFTCRKNVFHRSSFQWLYLAITVYYFVQPKSFVERIKET